MQQAPNLTKLEDGQLYIIRAVGTSLTDAQLCKGLWDTISWDTRPHHVNTRSRSFNDHIIFAATAPREDSAGVLDRRNGTVGTGKIDLLDQDKIDKQAGWSGMRTYCPPQ